MAVSMKPNVADVPAVTAPIAERYLQDAIASAARLATMIESRMPAAPADARAWADLRRMIQRASGLADLIVEGRRARVGRQPVDVGAFVAALEPALRATLPENVTLDLRTAIRGGVVLVNPADLDCVVRRLVASAQKAMPWGGEIAISVGWLDEAPTGDPAVQPAKYLRLTVSDTRDGGEPVPMQGQAPTSGEAAGDAGSVWPLVVALGAALIREPGPDQGSRAHVLLPVAVTG